MHVHMSSWDYWIRLTLVIAKLMAFPPNVLNVWFVVNSSQWLTASFTHATPQHLELRKEKCYPFFCHSQVWPLTCAGSSKSYGTLYAYRYLALYVVLYCSLKNWFRNPDKPGLAAVGHPCTMLLFIPATYFVLDLLGYKCRWNTSEPNMGITLALLLLAIQVSQSALLSCYL